MHLCYLRTARGKKKKKTGVRMSQGEGCEGGSKEQEKEEEAGAFR